MAFKLQGQSSILVIQPCYDGRVLPIAHHVAAEGLALLSIKVAHQNCTMVRDSGSKLTKPSCTQGIKPRNSFWNLHKPELKKVKGFDGTTTENIIDLLKNHNSENTSVRAYKKKVVSKLESILYKKPKPIIQGQALQSNMSWPINQCVLSSIVQETELVNPEILRSEKFEKAINNYDFETCYPTLGDKDAVFITLPSSNMHGNTSDDFIPAREPLNPKTGDCSSNTSPFNIVNSTEYSQGTVPSQQGMSSTIMLETKPSQHQISIPSEVEFYKENCTTKTNKPKTFFTEERNAEEHNIFEEGNVLHCDKEEKGESLSSLAVRSLFSDIFQNIEDIKDAINSYMSSFYVQEEEYDNYPKVHTPTDEVAAYFFECLPLKEKSAHITLTNSFPTNVKDCCNQLSSAGSDETIHENQHKVDNITILKENSTEENKISSESQNEMLRYCFWDGSDLQGDFRDELLGKTGMRNISEKYINTALVTTEFMENTWKEFRSNIETHALFMDLVNENGIMNWEHERNTQGYDPWAPKYDPSIFQEADDIVHTLNSLLMNGFFSADESSNATYIPCTIVELAEEMQFVTEIGNEPSRPDGVDWNSTLGEQENIMSSGLLTKETTPGNDLDSMHSEPFFHEEKVVLHELEYSREPDYKIVLESVNLEGRVDFLIPQTNYDLKTVETENHKLQDHINYKEQRGKPSENYLCGRNSQGNLKEDSCNRIPVTESNEKNIFLQNNFDGENPDSGSSMFERIREINSPGFSNSSFLFSTPNVPLNLTNPHVNRK